MTKENLAQILPPHTLIRHYLCE